MAYQPKNPNGQATMANSEPVVLASDQSPVPVSATSLPLPSGGATSAKQDTGNTSLSSIDGKIIAVNTGDVTVASSVLPTGAATAAKQDTGNTSLSSIDGKITAVNTGAVVVSSSALPSGAATSAGQSTANSSLATIATNTGSNATSTNQTNGTQQSKVTDGTNVASVLKSDGTAAGQNSLMIAGSAMTTTTLTLNLASPATAWFDLVNYPWVSVEILSNSSGATLTFQTSGDAAQTNISTQSLISSSVTTTGPVATTTSATATFHGPRTGRYFRISSNVSGANTVTLVLTLFTLPSAMQTMFVAQGGTWNIGSSSATASAVPANAFYVAGNGSTGNLTGLRMSDFGDGQVAGILAAGGWLYNGSSEDKARANEAVSLLASAARTTTQTSADLVNYNGLSHLDVILDVTSAGTGSVTVTINGKDPASGKYYLLLSGAAVVTNSTNRYSVSPHVTAAANVKAQDVVPRIFQIVVTANNANSMTYSVGYNLSRST